MRYLIFSLFIAVVMCSLSFRQNTRSTIANDNIIASNNSALKDTATKSKLNDDRKDVLAQEFVEYAKTLIGTPYVWGSVDPRTGFDCSGFINHVSNRFGLKVPRSSIQFTNIGTTVEMNNAQPGDLILFTGTDPGKRVVGHIGIVTNNQVGNVQFIHSSSGKAKGVIISDLSDHYKSRFVKVIRIFHVASDKVVV